MGCSGARAPWGGMRSAWPTDGLPKALAGKVQEHDLHI